MMILKNKLCGSVARLGRGFQTRPYLGPILRTSAFNILNYFNIVQPLVCKTVTRLCQAGRVFFIENAHAHYLLNRLP